MLYSNSDAESGRSNELIQNGRPRPGAIPPDALYTGGKRDASNASPDNRPLYENIKVCFYFFLFNYIPTNFSDLSLCKILLYYL